MNGPATAAVVAVSVYLDYQRHPLHTLLRGEVRAQTVHRDEDLQNKKTQNKMQSISRDVCVKDTPDKHQGTGRYDGSKLVRLISPALEHTTKNTASS